MWWGPNNLVVLKSAGLCFDLNSVVIMNRFSHVWSRSIFLIRGCELHGPWAFSIENYIQILRLHWIYPGPNYHRCTFICDPPKKAIICSFRQIFILPEQTNIKQSPTMKQISNFSFFQLTPLKCSYNLENDMKKLQQHQSQHYDFEWKQC